MYVCIHSVVGQCLRLQAVIHTIVILTLYDTYISRLLLASLNHYFQVLVCMRMEWEYLCVYGFFHACVYVCVYKYSRV